MQQARVKEALEAHVKEALEGHVNEALPKVDSLLGLDLQLPSLSFSLSLSFSRSLSLSHPHSQPCCAHALSASHPLHRSVQRFRGRLVLEAHGHCVSLNYRLESNEEEANRPTRSTPCRSRAKRDQLERFPIIPPARQGRNLAVTVLSVPHSLDSSSLRGLISHSRMPEPLS